MMKKLTVALALVTMVVAVTAASSTARTTSGKRIAGLPNTCKTYGNGKYVIASDLPLQGSLRPLSVQIVQAIRLQLKKENFTDRRQDDHVRLVRRLHRGQGLVGLADVHEQRQRLQVDEEPLGVIGTFNSGCAAIIAPILNRAPGGPIAMVSPANTYVGLTKKTLVPGEPEQVLPVGQAQLRARRACRTTSRARPTPRS